MSASPSPSPSPAAARAEARRKAILARGGDRLAKLTSSSRADDPVYANVASTAVSASPVVHDDPPLPSFNVGSFLGEDGADMPVPRYQPAPPSSSRLSPSPSPAHTRASTTANVDPSIWSEAQQEQLMAAFMGGNSPTPSRNNRSSSEAPVDYNDPALNANLRQLQNNMFSQFGLPTPPQGDEGDDVYARFLREATKGGTIDPSANNNSRSARQPSPFSGDSDSDEPSVFGALGNMGAGMGALGGLGALGGAMNGGFGGDQPSLQKKAPPRSFFHRLLPLIHLFCTWAVLAFFVAWVEPNAGFVRVIPGETGMKAIARRWGGLMYSPPEELSFGGVGAVPFFSAFITLQLLLHAIRYLTTSSSAETASLPVLLQLALPHLPPPVPTVVRTGIRYARMAGVFADDVAGLVVGLGICVWVGAVLSDGDKVLIM